MQPLDEMPSTIGLLAHGVDDGPSSIRVLRVIKLGAGMVRVLIGGASSDGRLELFEFRVPPGQPGPGLHTHDGSDECFTLLDGSAAFRIGEVDLVAIAGQSLVVPRRVPHSWHIVGEHPLRMLVTFTPAIGMEHYFAELSACIGGAAGEERPPTMEQMRALWSKYDTRPA